MAGKHLQHPQVVAVGQPAQKVHTIGGQLVPHLAQHYLAPGPTRGGGEP